MQAYAVSNKKEFMLKLLKSDLFDNFEVREVILHTTFKMILEGKRNQSYYDSLDENTYSLYITWGEMRKYVYELIQGNKPPTYFKIILAASDKKTLSLSEDVSAFHLTILFKENQISCNTGTSYKSFVLDQSADQLWDKRIEDFLFLHHFI